MSDSSTIPLINVVFLMLIFLLVAGTLRQFDNEGLIPPHVAREAVAGLDQSRIVQIREGGVLVYDGATLSADTIAERLKAGAEDAGDYARQRMVWVLTDRALDASEGMAAIKALQNASVRNMRLIVSLDAEAQ
ncbi:ExbD/TolR family protein [Tepidamorphus sp. 3E244]|uniref:ExbD/TolR family protein n=1 Tax=Tepidamorphus sp. 3E244 TaxID=3385498 RepID=UPI0038FBEEEE